MNKACVNLCASLGNAISVSRRARKIKQADLAAQAGVGMNTMVAIEKGSTTVQMGFYLEIFIILGMDTALTPLINLTADEQAVQSMANKLPKRVIGKRRARAASQTEHYGD